MLSDDTLNAIPERIASRLEKVNEYYLETIGEHIKKISTLTSTDTLRLQQMKKFGGNVQKITAELEKISSVNAKEIQEIYDIIADDNVQFSEQYLGEDYIPYKDNANLQRWVHALAKQSVSDYQNMSRNTAFMSYDVDGNKIPTTLHKNYSEVIDKAITAVTTGQSDFYGAMRKTLRDVADFGIRTVYNPKTGKAGKVADYASGYSRRLDTAVRQNLLWGMKQCNLGIQEQVGQTYGADGYEIDYHPFPRPTHEEMGGRQYTTLPQGTIIDGVYFPPFAQVEGLLNDYGCLHFKWPIICGVSVPAHSEEELAKLKAEDKKLIEFDGKQYTKYELSQIQRQLETAIRHAKDRQIIAKAAGDDTLRRREQARINSLVQKYNELNKTAGFSSYKERMSVSGYHRVKTFDELKRKDIKIDITENGKFTKLPFSDIDDYYKYIEHEYSTQKMTKREADQMWDKEYGYLQNADGYRYINGWLRGIEPKLDKPGRNVTINIMDRLTKNNTLKKDYIGIRKVNMGYFENVLGLDINGLTREIKRKPAKGRPRETDVPKNKEAAQKIVNMLNSIVGTKNGTIIDKGFTSISLCEDINFFNHYPVSFEIQMPKGTKGIITSNLAESEFITQIGTGIEIIGAEVYNDMGDNCIKIYGRIVQ